MITVSFEPADPEVTIRLPLSKVIAIKRLLGQHNLYKLREQNLEDVLLVLSSKVDL